jgi:hypothetical protein
MPDADRHRDGTEQGAARMSNEFVLELRGAIFGGMKVTDQAAASRG